jgi:hypothetical protein
LSSGAEAWEAAAPSSAGVPRSQAMKITGHRTEAVYRRDAIVSEADLREAVQKLDGYIHGDSRRGALDERRATL